MFLIDKYNIIQEQVGRALTSKTSVPVFLNLNIWVIISPSLTVPKEINKWSKDTFGPFGGGFILFIKFWQILYFSFLR